MSRALWRERTCRTHGAASCLLACDKFCLIWHLWDSPWSPSTKTQKKHKRFGYRPLKGVVWVSLTVERIQSRGYRQAVEDLSVPRRQKRWGHQLLHQAQDEPPHHRTPLVLPLAEVGGQAAWCHPTCQAWLRGGPHHLGAQGSLSGTWPPCYQHPRGLSRHSVGVQAVQQLVQGPFPAVETPTPKQARAAAKSTDTHLFLGVWHPGDHSLLWTPHPMSPPPPPPRN